MDKSSGAEQGQDVTGDRDSGISDGSCVGGGDGDDEGVGAVGVSHDNEETW